MSTQPAAAAPQTCPVCGRPYQYSVRESDLEPYSISGYRHVHYGTVYVHALDSVQSAPSDWRPSGGGA